jgi:hypothetical protein
MLLRYDRAAGPPATACKEQIWPRRKSAALAIARRDGRSRYPDPPDWTCGSCFKERNGRGRYTLGSPGAGLRATIPDAPSVFIQPDHRGFAMIDGDFNSRTLANMEVALDRVCGSTPLGEQYDVRKRVAEGILQCARHGRTMLGALTEAGVRALARIPETTLKSA